MEILQFFLASPVAPFLPNLILATLSSKVAGKEKEKSARIMSDQKKVPQFCPADLPFLRDGDEQLVESNCRRFRF